MMDTVEADKRGRVKTSQYCVHFSAAFHQIHNKSVGFQRVKTRPAVTDSLTVCSAPETLLQRGGEKQCNSPSRGHRVLKASLPLPSSPVTNYLCYFTHPPSANSRVCYSDTSCLSAMPDGAHAAQVLPCRRVSARWSGSPAAPAASRRAGRWLCGPAHTAPGDKMKQRMSKCDRGL